MKRIRVRPVLVAIVLLGMAAGFWPARMMAQEKPSPALVNTCLITDDVQRLVSFYEQVLQIKAQWSGTEYAEFPTKAGVLAIFSGAAQERYIPGSARAGANRSVILEFRVGDPDAEYKRLNGFVKIWVKLPTTQPWGTRSVYFRDPDGNLVDLFRPAAGK